ncbi:hypothetical protein LQD23_16390 [Chromobacterium violaceum]|uniref:hypothetical protein n=1 Tax=Chromobacterium violaceum TaxID=536 RepID=UPI001E29CDC5|nr:hypothetical protein [Chromobacterium violaceum]MCD0493861.1 hypothetical protein [Chromobacterium violaceum]
MHPIDAVPYFFPIIRVGALLMIALIVGIFAASFVNYRMQLLEYPDHQRKKWRLLAFELSTVAMVVLGSLVMFLPA